MSNLEKLKELFPENYKEISSVYPEWLNEEYKEPIITNEIICTYYFGLNNNIAASESFWDKKYKGKIKHEI